MADEKPKATDKPKSSNTTEAPDVRGDARTDAVEHESNPGKRTAEKKPPQAAGQTHEVTFGADQDELSPAQKEWKDVGVDPRVDNRMGRQRPRKVEWPAKPQQVDGPEVGEDFSAHYPPEGEKFRDNEDFEPMGQHSAGRHGLGEDDDSVGGTKKDPKKG